MTPTIIIGLGSTGKAVLLKIRKMIVERYGDLDELPIIAFLLVDIGTDVDTNKQKAQSLKRHEKVYIRVDKVDARNTLENLFANAPNVSKKLGEYKSLEKWLNRIIEDSESNFDEVFQISELCEFFLERNSDVIKKKFLAAYTKVIDIDNHQEMIDNGISVEEGVNVILLGSIWEGVGSGMFLKLADYLRDWIPEEVGKVTISNNLFFPKANNLFFPKGLDTLNDRQNHNSIYALKKLDPYNNIFSSLFQIPEETRESVVRSNSFDFSFNIDVDINIPINVDINIPDLPFSELKEVMEVVNNICSSIGLTIELDPPNSVSLGIESNTSTVPTKVPVDDIKKKKNIRVIIPIALITICASPFAFSWISGFFLTPVLPPNPSENTNLTNKNLPFNIYVEDVIEKADKIDTSLPNQEKIMMDGSVSMVTLMSNLRKKSFNEQEYKKKSQYGDMNFIQNEMPPEQEKPNGSTKARENMLMSARENKLMNNDVLSIVASSSPLKESDKVYLQEFPIAYDSIAVVVNKENPVKVKSLSLKQLRSIYQGETKFWEDISGGERKNRIKVYQRSKNSGTREVFKNIILGENEDFVEWQEPDYYEEETSDKDSPSVRKVQNKDRDRDWTNNGIYYMTSSEAIKQEKDGVITIVKIDKIYPEPENILDGKYKLSRMVYLVIPNKSRVTVQEFIRNVLSEEGQKIVEESGFIPLKSRNSKINVD